MKVKQTESETDERERQIGVQGVQIMYLVLGPNTV